MSSIIGLDSVRGDVDVMQSCMSDVVVPWGDVAARPVYDADGGHLSLVLRTDEGRREMDFTQNGFRQLCAKLGINAQFMAKCPAELQSKNINHFLAQKRAEQTEKGMLWRLVGLPGGEAHSCRAVLSGKYGIFDHHEVLDIIDDTGFQNFEVKHSHHSMENMHLRIVHAQKFEVGDHVFQLGLRIRNSEVGQRLIEYAYMLYEQICTNGMMATLGHLLHFKKRHVGEIDREVILNEMQEARAQAPDAMKLIREQMERVNRAPIAEEDWLRVENALGKRATLKLRSDNEVTKPDATVLDLTRVLTEHSQTFSQDRRELMDETAGAIATYAARRAA